MPRLTPEERETRRKARAAFSFSDAAYTHYDPKTEGYGSYEEWVNTVEQLLNDKGIARPQRNRADTQLERDLATLYLDALPATGAALKTAFRNTLKIVHPDVGGPDASHDRTVEAIKAFERLSKQY
jgi:hypothetical protein